MPKGKNLVRILWVALLVVFMAAVLPRAYPAFIEPYIVFGGILIYVIGGLGIAAFVRKSQGGTAK
jgi:hypothetical protein